MIFRILLLGKIWKLLKLLICQIYQIADFPKFFTPSPLPQFILKYVIWKEDAFLNNLVPIVVSYILDK